MTRALEKAIQSWLHAERGGEPRRAELALRRVFLRLPVPAPPAGFARRVLRGLGLTPAVYLPRLTLRWKLALGSCFVVVALATAVLPAFLADLWLGFGPGRLVDFMASVLVALNGRLAVGITVWEALAGIAQTVASSLASPHMIAAICGAALLCAVALRWLHGLLIPERNRSYVSFN